MLTDMRLEKIFVLCAIAGLALMVSGPVRSADSCDRVAIEAGEYRIKHSSIKRIVTTHNMNGAAFAVLIVPPSEIDPEIIDLTVSADSEPMPMPSCRVVQRPDLGSITSCSQSLTGVDGLQVVATFKISKAECERKMADVIKYLIEDVFDCGPSGTPI